LRRKVACPDCLGGGYTVYFKSLGFEVVVAQVIRVNVFLGKGGKQEIEYELTNGIDCPEEKLEKATKKEVKDALSRMRSENLG